MNFLKNILTRIFRKYFNLNYFRLVFLIIRGIFLKKGKTRFNGLSVEFNDSQALIGMYNEIFLQEFYRFATTKTDPIIIDCGSNIGLSILYFHKIYPNAKLIGIEADIEIANMLKRNLVRNNCIAEIIDKAAWNNDDQTLHFGGVGADAGSIYSKENIQEVRTVRLKNILLQYASIDFLKIDIEGAENVVLEDCKDELTRVQSMFVEFHSFPNERQNLDKTLKIITDAGFKYQLVSARKVDRPYLTDFNGFFMDLQMNIFCYRN